jgi:hypothetical protein
MRVQSAAAVKHGEHIAAARAHTQRLNEVAEVVRSLDGKVDGIHSDIKELILANAGKQQETETKKAKITARTTLTQALMLAAATVLAATISGAFAFYKSTPAAPPPMHRSAFDLDIEKCKKNKDPIVARRCIDDRAAEEMPPDGSGAH